MPLRSVRWKSGRGFDKLDSDKPPVIEEVALARQVHANCIRRTIACYRTHPLPVIYPL